MCSEHAHAHPDGQRSRRAATRAPQTHTAASHRNTLQKPQRMKKCSDFRNILSTSLCGLTARRQQMDTLLTRAAAGAVCAAIETWNGARTSGASFVTDVDEKRCVYDPRRTLRPVCEKPEPDTEGRSQDPDIESIESTLMPAQTHAKPIKRWTDGYAACPAKDGWSSGRTAVKLGESHSVSRCQEECDTTKMEKN
ncbi:hypothetical protein Q8A67_021902 [Cirrhinus molitorella]|uniref:Uncharacterized protein n=1 Tax=Cirrhinus molitorella TaxID=172907 RepID=A0AA88TCD4_9TELE|nr:hypothetical protein Q8A67_021902 [Cirrhinus molitorella]